MAFRVTDADAVRACRIGNRAVASTGSSRLSPRRKSKEPLSRRVRKSSQHVRACAAGDGAICSKNGKIVPYHGANPNTRNGSPYGLRPRLWLLAKFNYKT